MGLADLPFETSHALAVAAAIVIYVLLYNRLTSDRLRVAKGWSGIQVQLKRRHDLVPNLVAAVRGAMAHERGVIDAILAARAEAVRASASGDARASCGAEARLSSALGGLTALAESNPDITATANIAKFQEQLEEAEDQIAAARRIYNAHVHRYNAALQAVPSNIVGRLHRFEPATFFEMPAGEATLAAEPPGTALERR